MEDNSIQSMVYWRQIILAITIGVTAAYLASERTTLLIAIGVGLLTFVSIRVIFATVARTRYWLPRGTRSIYSISCPKCGQYIYRMSGDWILKCHQCGWTAGYPVIRWVTESVPSRQFIRSMTAPYLLITLLATGVLLAGINGASVDDIQTTLDKATPEQQPRTDTTQERINNTPTGTSNSDDQNGGSIKNNPDRDRDGGQDPRDTSEEPGQTPESTNGDGESNFDREKVEDLIVKYTIEERGSNLIRDPAIRQRARRHSEDMADRGKLYHGDVRGRYPCDYAGENAFKSHWERNVIGVGYIDSNKELARHVVNGWMNSSGHRRNILRQEYSRIGVGVHKEGNLVYVTQGFCG